MPTTLTNERPSLETTLEKRYLSQKCGGAYDAKEIRTKFGDRMPIYSSDGTGTSLVEVEWSKPNFAVKMPQMADSEYNDVPPGESGLKSKEVSKYIKGFTSVKYHP